MKYYYKKKFKYFRTGYMSKPMLKIKQELMSKKLQKEKLQKWEALINSECKTDKENVSPNPILGM